jgi:hypothetical protein
MKSSLVNTVERIKSLPAQLTWSVSQLCSTSQIPFVRPDCSPEIQRGYISGSLEWVNRALSDAHDAARRGCSICRLVIVTQEIIHQHSGSALRLQIGACLGTTVIPDRKN